MLHNYQIISLVLIIVFCAIFCILFAWKKPKSKNNRSGFLWKLFVFSALSFSTGLLILVVVLPQSLLNTLSWVIYDFLISYVFFVEIPAYWKISKFDDKLADLLKDMRAELIMMPFSYDASLENLKTRRNDSALLLKEENIDRLLKDFIAYCDKVNNFNERLWNLPLNESSSLIEEVTKRSKHPFPKLIDILALSGLSILLAQFLKLF